MYLMPHNNLLFVPFSQKSAVTCWDGAELGLKPKCPCPPSTTNQLHDPWQVSSFLDLSFPIYTTRELDSKIQQTLSRTLFSNTLPSTPCWTRSTPVWTTWRRRMTTSMPASRNCLNPTGRLALSSSSSLGRPLVMPTPRLWGPPARPQP